MSPGRISGSGNLRNLSGRIFYLPESDAPLSADVFFIETDSCVYVYDVGSCKEAREHIAAIGKDVVAVLSHFHADHTKNMGEVACRALYAGRETLRHVGDGTVVEGEVVLDPSVPIRLLPLPSGHAKDCVMLCYGREYAFCGDALYAAGKKFPAEHAEQKGKDGNGQQPGGSGYVIKMVYNVQKLQEMITVLKKLDVTYLVLSHRGNPVQPKDAVIRSLEMIYQKREKDTPYIVL